MTPHPKLTSVVLLCVGVAVTGVVPASATTVVSTIAAVGAVAALIATVWLRRPILAPPLPRRSASPSAESSSRLPQSFIERQRMLIALTRKAAFGEAERDDVLHFILTRVASALQVARASVWSLASNKESIRCLVVWDALRGLSFTQGVEASQAPEYFAALESNEVIAVEHAGEDARTRELKGAYLDPLGITSMLIVRVFLQGKWVGVLNLEHIGPPRCWHTDEQIFVQVVANLVSLVFERAQRARADERSRRDHDRHRRLLELLPDAVVCHRDGRVCYANQSALRLYGVATAEELLGSELLGGIAPASLPLVRERLARLAAGATSLPQAEIVLLRQDGSEVRSEIASMTYEDEDGKGVLSVCRDITARRQTESQLEENQRFITQVAATMPDTLYVYDLHQAKNVYINRPFAELLGYSEEDAREIGDNFLTFTLHPEDVRPLRSHHLRFGSDSTQELSEIEYRMRGKDGNWRWILSRESVFRRTEDGKPWQILGVAQNVTEKKRAHDAMQRSEERLRELAETIPECFWVADVAGKVQYVSPAFQTIYGRPDTVLIEGGVRVFAEHIHPDDRAEYLESIKSRTVTGGREQEYRYFHPDGSLIWVRDHAFGVRDANGKLLRFVGYSEDVTGRREAEEILRNSEAEARKLALVASKTDNAVIITDAGGRVEWVNEAFTRLTEYTFEEAQGRKPGHLLQGPDTDPVTVDLMRQAEREGRDFNFEILNYSKSGRPYWLSVEAQPILDENGKLVQFIAVQRDITQRKKAELERDRFFALSTDVMGMLRFDGSFVRVNPAFERLFGLLPDDSSAFRLQQIVEPDSTPLVEEFLREVVVQGAPHLHELPCLMGNGAVRWMSFALVPALELNAIYFVGRDIHETKLTHTSLQLAKESAEAASAAKNEFLSKMSHELRTPLNAILGFAQLLQREELSADQGDSVMQILAGGRHLLALINDILDVSRIEGGKVAFTLEPLELVQPVNEALDLMRPFADERGIVLAEVAVPPSATVLVDHQRFKQALVNLLSNAIKYNRPGGTVTLACTHLDDGFWRVSVSDQGEGIAAELHERLFQPFDRLGADRSEVEGTGLGLAIARGLVRGMGGRLDLLSTPGAGSTFWIDLPETECPRDRGETTMTCRRPTPRSGAAVLLYIEDNTTNRQLLEHVVRQRPEWRLVTAPTGEDGVRQAARVQPSLIVLDVHLPDLPGEEVLRRCKAIPDLVRTPVVVLSADATLPTQQRLRDAGADAYLTKPINLTEFLEVIETHLSRR